MRPTTLRDELVPLNKKYPLKELLAACERYLAFAPRDFITFEYCMLDGINDTDQHAKELIHIARQIRCKLNLIPFNPFPASGLKRSPSARVKVFAQRLMDAGIITTVRKTRGRYRRRLWSTGWRSARPYPHHRAERRAAPDHTTRQVHA